MFPLVSFIIPAYNHENYIIDAIDSAIMQTYKNIEIIIIDDGSTDSTWNKICNKKKECESRFVRCVFIRQKNKGVSSTFNYLCHLAKGKYICSCASDDKYKVPKAIERMVYFLEEHNDYGLVVGDNDIIDENGNECFWTKDREICYDKKKAFYSTFSEFLKTYASFDESSFGTYRTLYKSNYIPNGYLFRKSIFNIIEQPSDKSPLEDWFIMLQFSKYTKFKYINEVLYSYRWHASNTIKKTSHVFNMEYKTREYEEIILKKIVNNPKMKLQDDVIDVEKNGILLSHHIFCRIFEIQKYKKGNQNIKKILFFSKVIAKWITK